jgi:hypothetical protein
MAKLVWLILPEQNDPSDEWEPRSVFATWELAVARIEDGAEPDDVEVEVEDEDHVECVIPEREEAYRIVRIPVEESSTTEVQRIERDKAREFLLMLLDPMRDRFTAAQGIDTGNFFVNGEFIERLYRVIDDRDEIGNLIGDLLQGK